MCLNTSASSLLLIGVDVKRAMDYIGFCLIVPILFPIFIFVAIAVYGALGKPIFFKQERSGFRGNKFLLWKFRSMTNDRDSKGELMPDADRLTAFGSFIRGASLDELPCFLNLLKGDIGLVGPRPLLPRYLPLYSAHQMRRHDVRPGITGWAQVNGRNNLTWEEKFDLDVWYVDNQSLRLDLKILFITVWKVLARKDVNQEGDATMPLFTGTPIEPSGQNDI